MIRFSFLTFLSTLLLCSLALASETLLFQNTTEEQRFQKLTAELRCLVCQNGSLADSNAELANDLRKEIYNLMQAGKSNAEIKHYLTERYSDFVLYDPPLKSGTWLLWFGPGLILVAGAIVVIRTVRRRAKPYSTFVDNEEEW